MAATIPTETTASKGVALVKAINEMDKERADFPGEHLLVLGIGVLLLWTAGRSQSTLGRLLAGAAGSAFVGRAASGTGGVARLAGILGGRRR